MADIPRSINDEDRSELDLNSARALFRSGDEVGGFALYESLAKRGYAPAMVRLAQLYLDGKGVAADATAAFQWFLHAAEADDASAMCWIGYLYYFGDGVATDAALAREWYLKAAEAGDAKAMGRLGNMHQFGKGGPIDTNAAREWFSAGAEAGDAESQNSLASVLLDEGKNAEAKRWAQKAAHQGQAESIKWLDSLKAHQLLNDKRYGEAHSILTKLAEAGSAWAHQGLGSLYWYGHGVRKDRSQSLVHYEAAYDGGEHSVVNTIGDLHFKAGHPEKALEWFRKESDRPTSSLYGQYKVLKTSPNLRSHAGEADEILKSAAAAGHVFARREMAIRMMKGQKTMGTRLQGLRAWFRLFPDALRLVRNDPYDERLGGLSGVWRDS